MFLIFIPSLRIHRFPIGAVLRAELFTRGVGAAVRAKIDMTLKRPHFPLATHHTHWNVTHSILV